MNDTQRVNGANALDHVRRGFICRIPISTPFFGGDWFALKAEAFAQFFGTPVFLVAQTIIVTASIGINVVGWTTFDVYPFILLNLAFRCRPPTQRR